MSEATVYLIIGYWSSLL